MSHFAEICSAFFPQTAIISGATGAKLPAWRREDPGCATRTAQARGVIAAGVAAAGLLAGGLIATGVLAPKLTRSTATGSGPSGPARTIFLEIDGAGGVPVATSGRQGISY